MAAQTGGITIFDAACPAPEIISRRGAETQREEGNKGVEKSFFLCASAALREIFWPEGRFVVPDAPARSVALGLPFIFQSLSLGSGWPFAFFLKMPESDQSEVLSQLAIMRRELRLMRVLLLFVSFAVAILIFAPVWAVRLAEWAYYLSGYAVPVAGFMAAALIVLVVVSRYAPPRPVSSSRSSRSPAAS